jgi:hypothetical protein
VGTVQSRIVWSTQEVKQHTRLTNRWSQPLAGAMTGIEIKPHRWGWKVFEAPGVEPVFPEKPQAIAIA